MRSDRLLNLAAALRENAADENGMMFDLYVVNELRVYGATFSKSCGTFGCAIGLACVDDRFPELKPYSRNRVLFNGEIESWETAARIYFEIDYYDTMYLFMPEHYDISLRRGAAAELAVADRIEKFVANPQSHR